MASQAGAVRRSPSVRWFRRREGRLGRRWAAVLAPVLPVLLVSGLPSPAAAQAVPIGIDIRPAFPLVLTVGQTAQPAQLVITNTTRRVDVSEVVITAITLNPACGSTDSGCPSPDPGVITLSPTAAGTAGPCAGRPFSVFGPDANDRSVFVPETAVVLGPPGQANDTCIIDFTFNVLRTPTKIPLGEFSQTAHVATVTASGQTAMGLTGQGVGQGFQISSVNKAQPALSTQALGARAVGGTVADVATLTGPVPVTGTVTFRLYGPSDTACAGVPVAISTNGVGGGRSTSDPYTLGVPGTHRYVAMYNGDANNRAVVGSCADPDEAVTAVPAVGGGRYTPLSPARILDTRTGIGRSGAIGPNTSVDIQVAGRGGVPATGASAVALNVIATQPTADSWLSLFPAGSPMPGVSSVNVAAGDTVPNLVVVKLGTAGAVSLHNASGTTHVVFDVAGWYSDAGSGNEGRFQSLVPARIVDTRDGATRLGPGDSLVVPVAGRGGVPAAGAGAAVVNVAVTGTTAAGYLTVFPTGEPLPNASNLNFDAGETVSNRVIAKLGTGGAITIYNPAGSTDVVVDVNGWFTDASQPGSSGVYTPLMPSRIADTRFGTGGMSGRVPGGGTVSIPVAGRGGVPATGAAAVILNVTVTEPALMGYLTLFPTGAVRPGASDLNYAPGENRANLVAVQLGTGGSVDVFTSGATHVVVDVAGWSS